MSESDPERASLAERHRLALLHTRFGWWLLVAALVGGSTLEALHAFKAGLYLDVSNETRRLLWTLAHAHAALFGLVHVAFAASLPRLGRISVAGRRFASRALLAGAVLLPGGFLLGGVTVEGGDPNLAIVLAPVGGGLLLAAGIVIALGVGEDGGR